MSDQFIRAQSASRLQHNDSHDQFAPLWIRYSEDRRLANRRMLVNNSFDLSGVNIFAAGYNHVFQAVQDIEIAARILVANVSRAERSVSEGTLGFLVIIPIAAHDIGAPSHQFAGLSCFHFLSRLVDDSNVDPRTGSPTGRQPVLSMLGISKA